MMHILNTFVLSQVFKLEGSFDYYLFVKPGYSHWSICSDLKGWIFTSDLKPKKRNIISGSAGLICPASPESKFSRRDDNNDWSFNKAGDFDKEDWEEGGVVVQCTIHDQPSVK